MLRAKLYPFGNRRSASNIEVVFVCPERVGVIQALRATPARIDCLTFMTCTISSQSISLLALAGIRTAKHGAPCQGSLGCAGDNLAHPLRPSRTHHACYGAPANQDISCYVHRGFRNSRVSVFLGRSVFFREGLT